MRNVVPAILGSFAIAFCVNASAQTANCDSAELRDVTGNVLVSTKDGMSTAVDKQTVGLKSRVTTTSRASVTISFTCGCDVKLKENERLDIENPAACPALLAGVTAVPVAAAIGAGTGATAGVLTGTNALVIAGVGVGGYLIYRNNRNQSPN
jgi:hypothetical protein